MLGCVFVVADAEAVGLGNCVEDGLTVGTSEDGFTDGFVEGSADGFTDGFVEGSADGSGDGSADGGVCGYLVLL